jgi:hypothetical protein
VQQILNQAHNGLRERGNARLKTTFKALRNVSPNPWRIGHIVAAALVLLHFDHPRFKDSCEGVVGVGHGRSVALRIGLPSARGGSCPATTS